MLCMKTGFKLILIFTIFIWDISKCAALSKTKSDNPTQVRYPPADYSTHSPRDPLAHRLPRVSRNNPSHWCPHPMLECLGTSLNKNIWKKKRKSMSIWTGGWTHDLQAKERWEDMTFCWNTFPIRHTFPGFLANLWKWQFLSRIVISFFADRRQNDCPSFLNGQKFYCFTYIVSNFYFLSRVNCLSLH